MFILMLKLADSGPMDTLSETVIIPKLKGIILEGVTGPSDYDVLVKAIESAQQGRLSNSSQNDCSG